MAGALVVHDKDHRRLPPDVAAHDAGFDTASSFFVAAMAPAVPSKHTPSTSRRFAVESHTRSSRGQRHRARHINTQVNLVAQGPELRLGILRVRLEATCCKGKGSERGSTDGMASALAKQLRVAAQC